MSKELQFKEGDAVIVNDRGGIFKFLSEDGKAEVHMDDTDTLESFNLSDLAGVPAEPKAKKPSKTLHTEAMVVTDADEALALLKKSPDSFGEASEAPGLGDTVKDGKKLGVVIGVQSVAGKVTALEVLSTDGKATTKYPEDGLVKVVFGRPTPKTGKKWPTQENGRKVNLSPSKQKELGLK